MQIACGLDVGTQGAKALLIDAGTGAVLSSGAAAYGLLPSTTAGRAEQWPSVWIEVR